MQRVLKVSIFEPGLSGWHFSCQITEILSLLEIIWHVKLLFGTYVIQCFGMVLAAFTLS